MVHMLYCLSRFKNFIHVFDWELYVIIWNDLDIVSEWIRIDYKGVCQEEREGVFR